MSRAKSLQFGKRIKGWWENQQDSVVSGIVSSALWSLICFTLVQFPKVRNLILKIPAEPSCVGRKLSDNNLYRYSVAITIPLSERKSVASVLVYANADLFIERDSLSLTESVLLNRRLGEEADGAFYGFDAEFDPEEGAMMSARFVVRSSSPLRAHSCEDFFIAVR